MMKHLLKLLTILFLVLIGASCSNSDDEPTPAPVITYYNADLQKAPNYLSVVGQTGVATAILNQTDKTIQVTVNLTSGIPFRANFVAITTPAINYTIPDGQILLNLSDKTSQTISGAASITKTFTLTDEQIKIITSSQIYVIVYLYYDTTTSSAIGGELKKVM